MVNSETCGFHSTDTICFSFHLHLNSEDHATRFNKRRLTTFICCHKTFSRINLNFTLEVDAVWSTGCFHIVRKHLQSSFSDHISRIFSHSCTNWLNKKQPRRYSSNHAASWSTFSHTDARLTQPWLHPRTLRTLTHAERNRCFHLLVGKVNFKRLFVSLLRGRVSRRQHHESNHLSAPLCIDCC